MRLTRIFLTLLLLCAALSLDALELHEADICIYGGTASGMMAAVAAAQTGKSVIVVEPSRWLGGMVGAGLGVATDCRYPRDVGGLTRMMLEKDKALGKDGTPGKQQALRALFVSLAKEHNLSVIYERRLGTVEKDDTRIRALVLDHAPPEIDGCPAAVPRVMGETRVNARVFIDASYEGDLMAASGVTYTVGRESRAHYDESMAGTGNLTSFDIDPYVNSGEAASGLLPMIDPEALGDAGSASRHTMAYNFRLNFVGEGEGEGTALGAPSHYDPERYALVRRALKTNPKLVSWPHNNYDRNTLISGGLLDRQAAYPDGSWRERATIWREWIDHIKIMHQLTGATATLRRGDYPETGDFPHQLYIRLARRMIGEYVMVQKNITHETTVDDAVGLGYYPVAMFPCRLVALDGKVAAEGSIYDVASPGPYPIAYRALTPRQAECGNLLVPVCLSASYVAISSMRLEGTYMLLGESAGIAAVRALEEGVDVQQIDRAPYEEALTRAGQILAWDGQPYTEYQAEYEAWKKAQTE